MFNLPSSHSTDSERVKNADEHLEKEDEEEDHEVDRAVVSEKSWTGGLAININKEENRSLFKWVNLGIFCLFLSFQSNW